MEFLPEDIAQYAEQHTKAQSPLLNELHRETHLNHLLPQMLAGHLQGAFLKMISSMIQADRILEIGTFTGYSAICLAEGLKEEGILHTIDIDEELQTTIKKYVSQSGFEDKIKTHVGNAIDVIPTLEEEWDLVFIDADKINYAAYYEMVLPRVRKGGYIIADNVLWSGHVLNPNGDKDSEALNHFNKLVNGDKSVDNILVPIRDGLMIIRKL